MRPARGPRRVLWLTEISITRLSWTKKCNSRSGGDDIAVLEGVVELLSSDETAGVGDVGHEPSTLLVGDLAEVGIVPVTGVGRGTANDETRLVNLSRGLELGIVDDAGLGDDGVGEGLEVDGGGGHLLFGSLWECEQ